MDTNKTTLLFQGTFPVINAQTVPQLLIDCFVEVGNSEAIQKKFEIQTPLVQDISKVQDLPLKINSEIKYPI